MSQDHDKIKQKVLKALKDLYRLERILQFQPEAAIELLKPGNIDALTDRLGAQIEKRVLRIMAKCQGWNEALEPIALGDFNFTSRGIRFYWINEKGLFISSPLVEGAYEWTHRELWEEFDTICCVMNELVYRRHLLAEQPTIYQILREANGY